MNIGEILIWEATNGLLADPRGDWFGDVGAVDMRAARFH
jgi:hypothetical protein